MSYNSVLNEKDFCKRLRDICNELDILKDWSIEKGFKYEQASLSNTFLILNNLLRFIESGK